MLKLLKTRPHPFANASFSDPSSFVSLWPKIVTELHSLYHNGRILQVHTCVFHIVLSPSPILFSKVLAFLDSQVFVSY
jgi:translation elongation factor EF-1alpha